MRLELWDRLRGVGVGVGSNAVLELFRFATRGDWVTVPRAGHAGVEAPVNKHAQACFTPPLPAGITLPLRFRDAVGGGVFALLVRLV